MSSVGRSNMVRGTITDPERFELASVVTKNSRTGFSSNRRLLAIRGGHLFYYSRIPKFFNGDAKVLEHFHELPKGSIKIVDISKIDGLEDSSPYFSIEFAEKDMMDQNDIRRTLVNEEFNFTPKNSGELTTWQFTCDNQFLKKRWVDSLIQLKTHFTEEQKHMEQQIQRMRSDSINRQTPTPEDPKSSGGSFSSRSSVRIPWRESAVGRKSYGFETAKYGFEFKDGSSPKSSASRLSDARRSHGTRKTEDEADFEMIIKQTAPITIEEAVVLSTGKKQEEIKEKPTSQIITPVEEVSQEMSLKETPQKQSQIPVEQIPVEPLQNKKLDTELYPQTPQKIDQLDQSFTKKVAFVPLIEATPEPPVEMSPPPPPPPPVSHPPSKFPLAHSEPTSKVTTEQNEEEGFEFQRLLGASCRPNSDFDLKLQHQRDLIEVMRSFRQKAISGLSDWLDSKSRGEQHYRVTQISNRQLLVEVGTMQLKVALLTTQPLTINDQPKIYFNEDAIKNLKREYKVYQHLFVLVCRQLKHQPHLQLRVPLAVYVEHKGVACLAFETGLDEYHADPNDQEWVNEKAVLVEAGYKVEWFNFKTTGKYLNTHLRTRGKNLQRDDETLKEYLKRIMAIGEQPKNHNILFEPPIDSSFLAMAQLQHASTSLQSLEKYVSSLKEAKEVRGLCPKAQIITALQYCIYCKQLRKVYRSAQGEMEQTHFFNLVFKKDKSLSELLSQAGCPNLTKLTGQLFSFIEWYFGVLLEIDQKVYEQYYSQDYASSTPKKGLVLSCTVVPIVKEYPVRNLQIVQSYSKLSQYLQTHHPLGHPALQRKKDIYHLSGSSLPLAQCLELLINEATFHYHEGDFISCIKKCREYEQLCPHHHTQLFPLYLLMLKAYSQFSEKELSVTLAKATELIRFNYGSNHSSLVNLYSLASFYYAKLAQQPNAAQPASLVQVATTLLTQAQQLTLSHFGVDSQQMLDNVLDHARLYRNIQSPNNQNYLEKAQKMLKEYPLLASPQNRIAVLTLQVEEGLKHGAIEEAQFALGSLIGFLNQKTSPNTVKHISKIEYELGFYAEKYQLCEEALERMWGLGNAEKIEAVEWAYRAGLRASGVSESDQLVESNRARNLDNKERGLLQIQQEKTVHGSLLDVMTHAIESKNSQLLGVVYFLTSRPRQH